MPREYIEQLFLDIEQQFSTHKSAHSETASLAALRGLHALPRHERGKSFLRGC